MGISGIWQWVIILVIVLILFGGRGKISGIMGDLGKGLRNFRTGMGEDDASTTIEGEIDPPPADPRPAGKKTARKTRNKA